MATPSSFIAIGGLNIQEVSDYADRLRTTMRGSSSTPMVEGAGADDKGNGPMEEPVPADESNKESPPSHHVDLGGTGPLFDERNELKMLLTLIYKEPSRELGEPEEREEPTEGENIAYKEEHLTRKVKALCLDLDIQS
ncbi:hypothetical protein LguiA_029526 [Lonicera macranthoides]